MNRTWVGIVLLVLLLVAGIISSSCIHTPLEVISRQLETASGHALSGQLSRAAEITQDALQHWESAKRPIAAFTDHAPLEQIDCGFALLRLYAAAGDPRGFAVICMELAMQLRSVRDIYALQWWNIL